MAEEQVPPRDTNEMKLEETDTNKCAVLEGPKMDGEQDKTLAVVIASSANLPAAWGVSKVYRYTVETL